MLQPTTDGVYKVHFSCVIPWFTTKVHHPTRNLIFHILLLHSSEDQDTGPTGGDNKKKLYHDPRGAPFLFMPLWTSQMTLNG